MCLSMPHSFSQIYIHLVLGTKYRNVSLPQEVRVRLYEFIGAILSSLECPAKQLGGDRRSRPLIVLFVSQGFCGQDCRRAQKQIFIVDALTGTRVCWFPMASWLWSLLGEPIQPNAGNPVYPESGGTSSENVFCRRVYRLSPEIRNPLKAS